MDGYVKDRTNSTKQLVQEYIPRQVYSFNIYIYIHTLYFGYTWLEEVKACAVKKNHSTYKNSKRKKKSTRLLEVSLNYQLTLSQIW